MDNYENLSRYRIFLCVAECKSISRAAQQLYLSQPAVSAAIRKLEENLNTTLFIRKPRGVILTEKGIIFYEYVKQAFEALYDAESAVKGSHQGGKLRIAASNVLCKYLLIPYLQRFTERYPKADVSITCTSSANAHTLLEECKIDIALMAKPAVISGLEYHPLEVIEDIFVCTPSYLSKSGYPQNNIFESGNIMLLNKDNVSRMHIDNYYIDNKISPSHILEVNDMDLLIEFAKMGIGVSCVVKQFVKNELENGELIEIKLPKPIKPRETGFLYNGNLLPKNENIKKFISI